jgi:hypothetical protein
MEREETHGQKISLRNILVLLGIVLLLMALLWPIWGPPHHGKVFSAATDCKNNLMNLAKAMVVYADENNGYYPSVIANNGRPASADDASRSMGLLNETGGIDNPKTFRCRADTKVDLGLISGTTGIPDRRATSYGYDPTHKADDPGDVPILSDSWCPGSSISNHMDLPTGQIKLQVSYIDAHIEVHKGPPFMFGWLLPDGSCDDPFTVNLALPIPSDPRAPRKDACIMGGVHDTRP